MAIRWILGIVLTTTLTGCFGSIEPSINPVAAATNTASGAITSTAATPNATAAQLVLTGEPAASVIAGSVYSFTPTVTAGSGVVTFGITGLPPWATFDSSTGTLSGTPSTAAVGATGDITIAASNGTQTGSVGPFVIRVVPETPPVTSPPPVSSPPPVVPPAISGTPATAVTSGQTYRFQPVASDAAGKPLTFAISNRPAWATFSTATGALTGVPTAAAAGTYSSIAIRVTDGTSSAALPAFAITVTAATPDMPVLGGTPATRVNAGQAYIFTPTASDPAGKTLTFSITNPPVWAAFNPATGRLSGTPANTQVGPYSGIVISADNGTEMTSLPAFTIQVNAAPPPDSPSISGVPTTAVTAGHAYGFTPTASDPAGMALTFSIVNAPGWARFNPANGSLSGTPATTETGSYPGIRISVSNGTASASLAAFSITVTAPTPPASPTLSGSPPTTVVAGSSYTFTPTATDPSGGTLVFGIANAPAWATFDHATGRLSGTPSATNVGTSAPITISVSDGTSSAALPAFSITVTAPPAPPAPSTGSATLNWTAPTQNTNGTPLTNLAGYVIYYSTNPDSLTQTIKISDPAAVSYVVSGLTSGTWYFQVLAYNSANMDSARSAEGLKTIN